MRQNSEVQANQPEYLPGLGKSIKRRDFLKLLGLTLFELLYGCATRKTTNNTSKIIRAITATPTPEQGKILTQVPTASLKPSITPEQSSTPESTDTYPENLLNTPDTPAYAPVDFIESSIEITHFSAEQQQWDLAYAWSRLFQQQSGLDGFIGEHFPSPEDFLKEMSSFAQSPENANIQAVQVESPDGTSLLSYLVRDGKEIFWDVNSDGTLTAAEPRCIGEYDHSDWIKVPSSRSISASFNPADKHWYFYATDRKSQPVSWLFTHEAKFDEKEISKRWLPASMASIIQQVMINGVSELRYSTDNDGQEDELAYIVAKNETGSHKLLKFFKGPKGLKYEWTQIYDRNNPDLCVIRRDEGYFPLENGLSTDYIPWVLAVTDTSPARFKLKNLPYTLPDVPPAYPFSGEILTIDAIKPGEIPYAWLTQEENGDRSIAIVVDTQNENYPTGAMTPPEIIKDSGNFIIEKRIGEENVPFKLPIVYVISESLIQAANELGLISLDFDTVLSRLSNKSPINQLVFNYLCIDADPYEDLIPVKSDQSELAVENLVMYLESKKIVTDTVGSTKKSQLGLMFYKSAALNYKPNNKIPDLEVEVDEAHKAWKFPALILPIEII